MTIAPSFVDLIRRALDSRLADVHVALPGEVQTFDADKQVCDVKPLIKSLVPTGDGELFPEALPILPNIPVSYPRSEDFQFYFKLKKGSGVLLIFSERPLTEWYTTGLESVPLDARMHGLYAVAIPGLYPAMKPMVTTGLGEAHIGLTNGPKLVFESDVIEVRGVGGAAEDIAIASKVMAQFEALKTALTGAADGVGYGTALKALLAGPPGAPVSLWPTAGGVGTSKFKVEP